MSEARCTLSARVAIRITKRAADGSAVQTVIREATSLLAAVLTAVVLRFVMTPGQDARMVFAIGTLGAFLTVRVIVKRVAMEFLPD